jgi:hypothetical protein
VCFLVHVLMVHPSTLAVTTDGECLTSGGFSLRKTVRFGSIEFITYCFSGLSLSPEYSDLGVVFMCTTYSRSPSL